MYPSDDAEAVTDEEINRMIELVTNIQFTEPEK